MIDLDKNLSLKSLTIALSKAYDLPKLKATVYQFSGPFHGEEAIYTNYHLNDGRIVECAKIIRQPLLSVTVVNCRPDITYKFNRGKLIERKIMIAKDRLVAIVAYGEWEEVNTLIEMLLDNVKLSTLSKEHFEKTGNIFTIPIASLNQQNEFICTCMRVTYKMLQHKILAGNINLGEIKNSTGASTVCGNCTPKILDILNQSTWMYVLITPKTTTSNDVCSFIIKPLYHKHLPQFQKDGKISLMIQIEYYWIERTYQIVDAIQSENAYEIQINKDSNDAFCKWLADNYHNSSVIKILK
jgi:bacterioferritin-associated ferredoxin